MIKELIFDELTGYLIYSKSNQKSAYLDNYFI